MFGRGALLFVMGLSWVFVIYTVNMIGISGKTQEAYVSYHKQTVAENLANTGANMACNAVYTSVVNLTTVWTAGYNLSDFLYKSTEIPINDVVVTVTKYGLDSLKIISTGTCMDSVRRVVVWLRAARYSKYGAYYKSNTAQFATGDTLDGPIHFNTLLKTSGSPVFLGRVTTRDGLQKSGSPATPQFLGGYESGVKIDLTLDISGMNTDASSGGYQFVGTSSKPFVNVDLTFNANGTVTYKTQTASSFSNLSSATWSTPVTTALRTLAPNGLILVKQGNITTRGTLNGQATIAALANGAATSQSGSTPYTIGNVFVDDDIVYNTDPRTNSLSSDMLGVVAENSVTVTYNNSRGDITMMGSFLAKNDGLEIDKFDTYTSAHTMSIYGGVIASDVKATASYSNGIPVRGYSYSQKYDPRFLNSTPPKYPMTNTYEVLSWNSFCPVCGF